MTNEELLSVAEIVERATNRFNEQAARFRERSAAYDRLIADMNADHERKLAEHRAAFGARTEADRRIIEGLRAIMAERGLEAFEAGSVLGCVGDESPMQAARRVVKERDGLLTQVKDQRAEIERLQWENQTMHKDAEDGYAEAIKVLGDPIALSKERDALRAEVEFLKTLRPKYKVGDKLESYSSAVTIVGVRTVYDCQTDGAEYPVGHSEDELKRRYEQTPKQHPVKVGEWVRRISLPGRQSPVGVVKQVTSIRGDGDSYGFADEDYWAFRYCEPCDQPATHDTEAGKAAAEAAVKTDPVAEEIKVWDVVEVYQATGKHTAQNDVGFIGTVGTIHLADRVAHVRSGLGMPHMVDLCDVRKVRKVTT